MIQQAQKFVIETNDSSDSRNVSVSMLYNKDSCFGCLIRCSSTIVVHRREKLKNMVKLIEHQNSKPPLPAFCLFFLPIWVAFYAFQVILLLDVLSLFSSKIVFYIYLRLVEEAEMC